MKDVTMVRCGSLALLKLVDSANRSFTALIVSAMICTAGCEEAPKKIKTGNADWTPETLAERTGSVFLPAPTDPYRSPRIKIIPVPDFPGSDAIWGSTGRDHRGHIWFGVSAPGGEYSAHLFEYDPERDLVTDRGDVLTNLKAAGLYSEGDRQIKIHSRIVQGDDGYLYFSSTDEYGEKVEGSVRPKYGSNLWRLNPSDNKWEHLHWVREGLTAIAGGGRWIYALGLWDHVLYQHDTLSGKLRRITVGSIEGHMSRNLIADLRGNVFVPRVTRPFDVGLVEASLVEFDSALQEVGASVLANYYDSGINFYKNHGISGLLYLRDESMVISTSMGFLYRITPRSSGPSHVEELGQFHPLSANYAPSLFTFAGERYVVGVSRNMRQKGTKRKKGEKRDKRKHVWVVYDLVV